MKRLFDVIVLIVIAAIIAAGVGLVGFVTYHWWHGILIGLEHFGVNMIVGAILILVALRPALFALAILGGWASVTLLGMHWFVALSLYATTIAFLLVATIIAALAAVAAFILLMIDKVRRG
jgi:hypothetical protein